MDDIEVIRKFVSESDLTEDIKNALIECIAIDVRSGTQSDYQNLLSKLTLGAPNEN